MISVGEHNANIFIIIVLFALVFFISWIISKIIKKNIFIIAIIIWTIIFIINMLMCTFNIPIVLGLYNSGSIGDSVNGKYISLGYGIEVKGHNNYGKSNIDMHIISLLDVFK